MKTETSIFENLNAAEMEAVKAGKSEVMAESMEAEAMGDGALLFCCDENTHIEHRTQITSVFKGNLRKFLGIGIFPFREIPMLRIVNI